MAQSSSGKYVIKVSDFEAMAKYVAETNSIEVPHRTVIAQERGIWGMSFSLIVLEQ
jgi:hypothetical protein